MYTSTSDTGKENITVQNIAVATEKVQFKNSARAAMR